ncbi:MurR/RpiR family transcriptional regulator [Brevibacterium luteolum]|uniref:MurR/RpiR family transcriptional regulator n=1 Tax=Brevibacterium luteolum TaxID=199591 RepID=UPI00223C50A0|nr:MurR/RpiR family transcriptional regulator [Brevibacterium luteolum]MCT1920732.1 MurR/RpiR family transcriptional regulator [Brevibacterium luteolum]
MTDGTISWIEKLVGDRTPSPAIARVLGVISSEPETAAFATAQQVATMAGVNVASATRCAQYLGYRGWRDFVTDLRGHYLATLTADRVMGQSEAAFYHTVSSSIAEDIRMLELLLEALDEDEMRAAARMIASARSTVILATGYCSGPGGVLAHGAQLFGFNVDQYAGSATAQINAARRLREEDVLVVFNVWKTTDVINQLALEAASRRVPLLVIADRSTAVTEVARHSILVSSGSPRYLPSMTGVFSIVQAVLKLIAAEHRESVEKNLRRVDQLWHGLGVVKDDPTAADISEILD